MPPILNEVAFTTPLPSYITALLFVIVPPSDPSKRFISVAVEVTPSRIFNSATVADIAVVLGSLLNIGI